MAFHGQASQNQKMVGQRICNPFCALSIRENASQTKHPRKLIHQPTGIHLRPTCVTPLGGMKLRACADLPKGRELERGEQKGSLRFLTSAEEFVDGSSGYLALVAFSK